MTRGPRSVSGPTRHLHVTLVLCVSGKRFSSGDDLSLYPSFDVVSLSPGTVDRGEFSTPFLFPSNLSALRKKGV